MGRSKISKVKAFLPSIVLLILVLVYISGYITFRAHLNQGSPQIASDTNLGASRKRLNRFLNDWIDENEARYDWRKLVAPCKNETVWKETTEWWKKRSRTDPEKSFISLWQIQPAGQYSRFFIQSQNSHGVAKYRGGDSWRVHIYGPASLNPLVRDVGNGTYEIKFLALESGKYKAHVYLDYSLCDGIKDPPQHWFIQGNAQGKDQKHGILGNDFPYIKRPLWNGEPIEFVIPEAVVSREEISQQMQVACEMVEKKSCLQLWNGLGRWVNFTWKPFCADLTYRNASRRHKGYLWIYGDSTATRLHWSIHGKPLCHKVFRRCFYSYGWIYQIDNYNLTLDQFIRRNPNRTFLKLNDNNDFNADRIVEELKQVLLNPKMDEYSVLLLNYGLHFAEASNFSNFRSLIDKIVTLLQNRTAFKPTVIWRSSTALNRHKYSMPHLHSRRFLTPQRVELFNAYSQWKLCRAGIPILDVHPLTNSYPNGTGNSLQPWDPVHYDYHVLYPVEQLLLDLFN